jgi:hypothetical protein
MRKNSLFISCLIVIAFACSGAVACSQVNAGKGHVMIDTIMGDLKIELHVLPAEPFFTKEQVAADKVTEGMLIMGGAKPLAPNAKPAPNHHLVVHVFDAKTGKAITDVKVKMTFQSLSDTGKNPAVFIHVPIVIMQAIGKGPESTHYGNNVVMPDGTYSVAVAVNGNKVSFKISLSSAPVETMKGMDMH